MFSVVSDSNEMPTPGHLPLVQQTGHNRVQGFFPDMGVRRLIELLADLSLRTDSGGRNFGLSFLNLSSPRLRVLTGACFLLRMLGYCCDKASPREPPGNKEDSLFDKRVELVNRCPVQSASPHLPFGSRVHQLNSAEQNASTSEILEAHHLPHPALDCPMILFHNIVQVLRLTNLDGLLPVGVNVFELGQIGAAFGDGYCYPVLSVLPDRLLEVPACRNLVPMGAQHESDGVAVLVHCPV